MSHDISSPVIKFTPKDADIDSVIDTYTVFQQQDLSIHELHPYLWPAKGKYGLRDYEKVYQSQPGNDVYDLRGVNRTDGCVVVVRPDQHIAAILPITAHLELAEFFNHFMIQQN